MIPAETSKDFLVELPRHRLDFTHMGATLVMTFDNAGAPHREPADRRPWGHKFLTSEGHSVLGVIAKESDWYRCRSLHTELLKLRESGFFRRFEKVVLTGSSMGGYAATAFASLSPGCRILSYNPQSTLNQDIVPWDRNHPNGEKQDWKGFFSDGANEISHADLVYVFFDPFHPDDRRHADRYQGDKVKKMRAPFLGHGLPDSFLRMGVLKRIMREGISGTLSERDFQVMMRGRKDIPKYYKQLINVSVKNRHTDVALKISMEGRVKFREGYFFQREAVLKAYHGDIDSALKTLEKSPRRRSRKAQR